MMDSSESFKLNTHGIFPDTSSGVLSHSTLECWDSEKADDVQTPIPSELLDSAEIDQNCSFHKGVVDECYKSRFWARVLEFYYFEEPEPEQDQVYHCLMSNCPAKGFKEPKAMLSHLKECRFFCQGLFKCPICKVYDKFRTVSTHRCSWERINLIQRLQKRFRNSTDFVRCLATSYSSLKSSPELRPYQKPGQHLDCPSSSLVGESPVVPGYEELPADIYLHELHGYWNRPELDKGGLLSGLREESSPSSQKEVQPNQFSNGRLDGSSLPVLGQSSSSSSPTELLGKSVCGLPWASASKHFLEPISELPSTSASETGMQSADVSPVSSAKPPDTPPTSHSPRQCLPTNYHRRVEGIRSAYDGQVCVDDGDHPRQTHVSCQHPRSMGTINELSPLDSVIHSFSSNRAGFHGGRGPQLAIKTNRPEIHLDTLALGIESTNSDSIAFNTMDFSSLPVVENFLSPSLERRSSPILCFGASINSPDSFEEGGIMQSAISLDNYSTPDTEITLAASENWLDPGVLVNHDDLRCTECDFRPSGKEQNFASYLRKHKLTHEVRQYKCKHCSKNFTRPDNRDAHIRKSHADTSDGKRRRSISGSLERENPKSKRASLAISRPGDRRPL